MAAKKQLALIARTPEDPGMEASKFLSEERVTKLKFWGELQPKEQTDIMADTRLLAGAMIGEMASRLAQGQYLKRIQETLLPYEGAFTKYLRGLKFIVPSTAYRYIAAFSNVEQILPKAVLHAAIVRGMDLVSYNPDRPLGTYTEAVRLVPPPSNPSPAAATKYLDQIEQTRKERNAVIAGQSSSSKIERKGVVQTLDPLKSDPLFLQIQCFRAIKNALLKIPAKQRKRWLERLVGTVLTHAGHSSSVTFAPEAIPEEFNQGRGRPKLVEGVIESSDVLEVATA